MNWVVQAASAVGTLAAVLVALFGSRIQRHLFPPQLTLQLADDIGVKAGYSAVMDNGEKQETEARWYHVIVENPSRWPAVTQVQVFLRQIEEADQFDVPHSIWAGDAPLQWANKGDRPLLLNIGHASPFDLCSVVKMGYLDIHPLAPLENQQIRWTPPVHIYLTVQARGVEGDSPLCRFEIKWDGKWSDDVGQMKKHVGVKERPRVEPAA